MSPNVNVSDKSMHVYMQAGMYVHVYVCAHVCMYVCAYICYVPMYICRYVCMMTLSLVYSPPFCFVEVLLNSHLALVGLSEFICFMLLKNCKIINLSWLKFFDGYLIALVLLLLHAITQLFISWIFNSISLLLNAI